MERVPGGVYCTSCEKKVWDLRDATEEHAHALFKREGSSVCVRIRCDASGKAVLRPRPRVSSSFVLVTSLIASASACGEGTSGEPTLDHSHEAALVETAGEPIIDLGPEPEEQESEAGDEVTADGDESEACETQPEAVQETP